MLHKLRIRVKRYRYAVDLFGVALAKGGGKPKELKRLQDRLGAFHDLVVRRRRLEEYVEPGPHAATVQDLAAHAAAAGALFLVTDSDLARQRQRLLEELRR
jgi:CHAD domain-containing protein